jgi:hypothetical protein
MPRMRKSEAPAGARGVILPEATKEGIRRSLDSIVG